MIVFGEMKDYLFDIVKLVTITKQIYMIKLNFFSIYYLLSLVDYEAPVLCKKSHFSEKIVQLEKSINNYEETF